jgi:glycosyltransferase involved in cell wall biosynthesis
VVTGELPDLQPCYLNAGVFVAPLLHPGGLKFKVPQAMAYGLPVVATSVAARGVVEAAPEGVFWAVTDDPRQMGQALIDVLRRPADAAAVRQRAASWCGEHFSFERSGRRLLESYLAMAAAPVNDQAEGRWREQEFRTGEHS